jgi:hypothetical protein
MKKYLVLFAVVALLGITTAAFAGTQAAPGTTVSPTLQINATVNSAIRLTLSTGTVLASHCSVSAGGTTDYAMNFGSVDALAIETPTCGSVAAPTTPGTTPAVYYSDYNLMPIFTGQSSNTGTITAQVTTNFATLTDLAVVHDTANSSAAPAGAGSFSAIPTASATNVATSVANASTITRYIGVAVSPSNAASGVSGSDSAIVTFTLTVP